VAAYVTKITGQGQVSIPAELRKVLGVGPGSAVEWEERDGELVVRRKGAYSFEDMHRALFPEGAPKPRKLEDLKEAGARHVEAERARGRY
jgi:AbrB family looped-hinge helix DNA binding protein